MSLYIVVIVMVRTLILMFLMGIKKNIVLNVKSVARKLKWRNGLPPTTKVVGILPTIL